MISKLCTLPIGTIVPTVVAELVAQVVSATETLEQRFVVESSRRPGLFKEIKLPPHHGPSAFSSFSAVRPEIQEQHQSALEQKQWRKILWLQDRAPAVRRERIYYRARPCTIHNVLQIFGINLFVLYNMKRFYIPVYKECLETQQHFLILHLKYRIYTGN